MPKAALVAVLLVLSSISASNSAAADETDAACGRDDLKAPGVPCGRVATAQKSAILQVPVVAAGTKPGVALEVTARPIAGQNAPYLVGVFVGDARRGGTPKLLGSFSFFPARLGETQTFVLPKPDIGPAGQNVTLSVKLIPANPERDIKDAAVEIVGARIVGE
jgi:hypothetical protein